MMITLYQIKLTEDQYFRVNACGFDSVPAAYAKYKMMLGAKHWDEQYIEFYIPVCKIDTNDLDFAFEATNLWEDYPVTKLTPCSSSSVGDLFVKENGEVFIIDNFGFKSIGFVNLGENHEI